MIELKLVRLDKTDKQIIGNLLVYIDGILKGGYWSIERPDKNNEPWISCIPLGEYDIELYSSEKHPENFQIMNVPNRSYILLHSANYSKQLHGCVAIGKDLGDLDNDGYLEILSSRKAMNQLNKLIHKKMKDGMECKINIIDR